MGESKDTTSGDDQLVCDALRLALVARLLRVAWHAGAIGAQKAMEMLDQETGHLLDAPPPRRVVRSNLTRAREEAMTTTEVQAWLDNLFYDAIEEGLK